MDAMLLARPPRLWRNKTDFFKPFRSSSNNILEATTTASNTLEDKSDEADLQLVRLNHSLRTLLELFPDVDPEYFRNMLLSISEESRVAVIAEHVLKRKNKEETDVSRNVLRRRNRTVEAGLKATHIPGHIDVEDTFRGEQYHQSVKLLLYQEFKQLSHSTIKAIMAENNSSYIRSRSVLQHLASKTWRYALTNFWSRKALAYTPDNHPAIIWMKEDDNSLHAEVKSLGCAQLEQELHETLVHPILERHKLDRLQQDQTYAIQLNDAAATEAEALYDCECCYSSVAFEQIASCDENCHLLCFDCIRRTANEAIYGQGWARSVDLDKSSLRCFAPAIQECQGSLSTHSVELALSQDVSNTGMWLELQSRITTDVLTKSRMSLQKCPFCTYAEIDEISIPMPRTPRQLFVALVKRLQLQAHINEITTAVLTIGVFPLLILYTLYLFCALTFRRDDYSTRVGFGAVSAIVAISSVPFLLAYFNRNILEILPASFLNSTGLTASFRRIQRCRGGLKFRCQKQDCGRTSCKRCMAEWQDPHTCFEDEKTSLRTAIEAAATASIKRTCPKCMLSFVKASGCNKLVCNCGYTMCYICRNEITSKVGYAHFCQHFRPNGGRCTECDKCDLYGDEDEEAAIRKAAASAELMWRGKESASTASDGQLSQSMIDTIVGQSSWQVDWLDAVLDVLLA